MEALVENLALEEYLKDDVVRQKHKKNQEILKLAITNVNLALKLKLKKGLTYDCSDDTFFNIRLPNNENACNRNFRYNFPETRFIVATHHALLKNNWLEPVKLNDLVDEVSVAYPPITSTLKCGFIRESLTNRAYSKRIFCYNSLENTVRPIYLPVKIEIC
jgi:hypothetical protein